MPNPQSAQKLNALLEHGGWVRALARSLVADPSTADDVEQKAWLAALEGPDSIRNPRSWFGGVIRNLSGMHWREQKARDRREELVGVRRAEAEASGEKRNQPDDLSERRETFRILAVAMGNLEEPYGTALYLRFFEELTMREIALRMKAPESTTKARIARGLEMLRAELASSLGGEWRHCCMALAVPLAKTAAAVGASTAIGLGLITKGFITAAAIVLVPLAILQPWDEAEKQDPLNVEAALAVIDNPSSADFEAVAPGPVDRINQPKIATPEAAFPSATLRIRVIKEESHAPVPDLELQFLSGHTGDHSTVKANLKGTTDETGTWQLAIPTGKNWIRINMPFESDPTGYTIFEDQIITENDVLERIILIPTSHKITLAVKDPAGSPMTNQKVRVSFGERDSGFNVHHSYKTNERGEVLVTYFPGQLNVAIDKITDDLYPLNAWLPLTAENDGFVQELTLYERREVEILVQDEDRQAAEEAILEFRFPTLDIETGRVSPESLRSWNRESEVIKTDAEGKVSVVLPIIESIDVTVKHPNYQPFSTKLPSSSTQQTIVLKSGGRVSGRILDEHDQPVAGAEVMAWASGEMLWGGQNPPQSDDWRRAKTDEQGKYLIHGLKSEGYFFLMVQAEGFAYYGKRWKNYPSGSIDLSLEPSAPLFGYALDENGEKLAQVWVEVSGEPVFDQVTAWETLSYYAGSYRQLTDEHGAFSFPGLFSGNHKLKINQRKEMLRTFHTGPDAVYLKEGDMDPGFILVDFEVFDANTHTPIANAGLWTFKTSLGTGVIGSGTKYADKDGHCISRLEKRDERWFKIQAEGYMPEVVWLSDFSDGLSSRKVSLEPSFPCTISFKAFDGLPLLKSDVNKSLGAALLRHNGFIMPGSHLSPYPANGHGVGAAGHSAVRESKTVFKYFPLAGGTLRVEIGTDPDNGGSVTHESFRDFTIPGGSSDYTLTFSLEDLRHLGLRD